MPTFPWVKFWTPSDRNPSPRFLIECSETDPDRVGYVTVRRQRPADGPYTQWADANRAKAEAGWNELVIRGREGVFWLDDRG